jgi:hypothetical protein
MKIKPFGKHLDLLDPTATSTNMQKFLPGDS